MVRLYVRRVQIKCITIFYYVYQSYLVECDLITMRTTCHYIPRFSWNVKHLSCTFSKGLHYYELVSMFCCLHGYQV